MDNHGYEIGSRYYILNYLSQLTSIGDQSTYASIQEVIETAYGYLNPEEPYSLSNIDTDTAMKVVTQCDNQYCNNCNDYLLSQCRSCWGRFAADNGACLGRTDCNTLGDLSFKEGCFQVGDDCMDCKICDVGYVLKSSNRKCQECKQTDENCFECSNDENEVTKCDICEEGYGINATSGACNQCTGENVKRCSIDGNDTELITMCDDEYVLNIEGTSCQDKTCGFAEFLNVSHYDEEESNKVIGVQC